MASAERQLAAERAFVGVAKADYLPRITVGGSAGYSASALGSLGDDGTFRYAVGPVLSWPALCASNTPAPSALPWPAAMVEPPNGKLLVWRDGCGTTV